MNPTLPLRLWSAMQFANRASIKYNIDLYYHPVVYTPLASTRQRTQHINSLNTFAPISIAQPRASCARIYIKKTQRARPTNQIKFICIDLVWLAHNQRFIAKPAAHIRLSSASNHRIVWDGRRFKKYNNNCNYYCFPCSAHLSCGAGTEPSSTRRRCIVLVYRIEKYFPSNFWTCQTLI